MKQQKGMTLVEVLISLVILAMLVTPFLFLFIQSTKGRLSVRNALYASQAASNYMEKLAAMNCIEISLSNGEFIDGNLLIKSESIPWAAQQKPCFYFIFQDNGQAKHQCMIIPPDGGKGIFLKALPEHFNIEVVIDKYTYQIYADSHSITGEIEEAVKPIILVNAAFMPEDVVINLNIEGNADVIAYSNQNGLNIECEQAPIINQGIYYRDYTLFRSVVEVFDAINTDILLSRVESILRIPN